MFCVWHRFFTVIIQFQYISVLGNQIRQKISQRSVDIPDRGLRFHKLRSPPP